MASDVISPESNAARLEIDTGLPVILNRSLLYGTDSGEGGWKDGNEEGGQVPHLEDRGNNDAWCRQLGVAGL